jgi:hypothetical protein
MRRSRFTLFLLAFFLVTSCSPVQSAEKLDILTHPDGPLYVGDHVSFEVLAPSTTKTQDETVEVKFNGQALGSASFSSFGIGGRDQATLWWVWNTSDLKPGRYTLTFTRLPDNLTWSETVSLHPASQVPPPEPQAHWSSVKTKCCMLHYITGTAAERDIAALSREADEQSDAVATQIGSRLNTSIDLILMPRVIGQGGFTTGSVYVSYLDGNYIGNEMPILFHHEFVHYYDGIVGGDYRPSMLQEGLAVYLTGGHFKPEPLGPRAAALLDLGWYIPLTKVADDFYNQQHDIGYLEAAALVKYLVETYGWSAFNEFYRTIPAPNGLKDSAVIDSALRQHFGVSFADLETAYLNDLRAQPFTDDERTDLRLTVEFFDTARRYQKDLDPSAYFLTAWLPDGSVMRQRNIVADLLRRPLGLDNRLVESLIVRAQQELFRGDYANAERTLKMVNWILQVFESVR